MFHAVCLSLSSLFFLFVINFRLKASMFLIQRKPNLSGAAERSVLLSLTNGSMNVVTNDLAQLNMNKQVKENEDVEEEEEGIYF